MNPSESALQAKTIRRLELAGWYVVRVFSATRAGVPDLTACDPQGKFWGIEIKRRGGEMSDLQKYNKHKIEECNGEYRTIDCITALDELLDSKGKQK